jgi:alkylation response protein AidB-like acyl-CoA dehydrogenase
VLYEEISRGSAAICVVLSVTNSFGCYALSRHGSEGLKEKYLGDIASGRKVVCFAQSEPNAGSDASAISTRARREGDGYVITGTKVFLSTGANAGIVHCVATLDPSLRHKGLTSFLIERDSKGVSVPKHEDKMGQRADDCVQMVFEDVYVPKENVIGSEGIGFKIGMDSLDCGRIGIASLAVGIAQRCLEISVAHASSRVQFGQPIGKHQAIAFKIADMATRVEASRLLVQNAASIKQAGGKVTKYSSMAKLFASDTAMDSAIETVQILSSSGLVAGSVAEHFFRDAKLTQIYEGTSEIQRIVISRALLE